MFQQQNEFKLFFHTFIINFQLNMYQHDLALATCVLSSTTFFSHLIIQKKLKIILNQHGIFIILFFNLFRKTFFELYKFSKLAEI